MPSLFEPKLIRLSGSGHIAAGKQQLIYEHPEDPTSLIKIYQPHKCDVTGNRPYKPDVNGLERQRFRDRFRRATAYRRFLREFAEYLQVKASCQASDPLLPISEIRGVVPTDLGLGMVYERISDPDGSLSPTLKDIVSTGCLTQKHLIAVDEFFERMIAQHLTVGDLNLSNIVYQTSLENNGRVVCIDGFAKKQRIPYLRLSKRLNTRELIKWKRKVQARFERTLVADI